ncbi:hypothetical protein D3C87_86040 [compost metagenome]
MQSEEILEWADEVYFSIWEDVDSKSKILKIDNRFLNQDEDLVLKNIKDITDLTLIKFYSCFKWWKMHWVNRDSFNVKVEGTFEFIHIEEVMQDWDDDFGGNSWAPDMKGFRPFDMFYEMEGQVGFFVGRPDKKGLYLSKTDGETQPLHVDFEGYLKLLTLSKGFGWWQNALIEISTGVHQPNTDSFRENMPKIFPEFNWDEFVALYQSVRIDK